jgi:hypothetical protein
MYYIINYLNIFYKNKDKLFIINNLDNLLYKNIISNVNDIDLIRLLNKINFYNNNILSKNI